MRAAAALALLCAGCGGDSPVLILSLGRTYDAVVAVRVAPEGGAPSSFMELYLTIDGVRIGGNTVEGTIGAKGGPPAVEFRGTFTPSTGLIEIPPLDATLTGTISERVDELGGRADDVLPRDGVADEITGFLRTHRRTAVYDGTLLATARDERPDPPDETKINVTVANAGKVTIAGAPGAMLPSAGVELFRFRLAARDPEFTLGQVRDDGAFELTFDGAADDLYGVRTRSIGRTSDVRFFRVSTK